MSLYSSYKEFRDSYVRRVLPSLDSRQLSRDGRQRNPNEKSVVVRETTEMVMKLNLKQTKEVSSSSDTSSNEATVKLDRKIEEELAKHKEIKRQLQMATNKVVLLNKEEQAERRVAREAKRAERKAAEQQKASSPILRFLLAS